MGASPKYKIYEGAEYIGSFKQADHAEHFCETMQQQQATQHELTIRNGHDRTSIELTYKPMSKVELLHAALERLERFGPSGGGILTLEEIKDHYESMTPEEYQAECKRLNHDDQTELFTTVLDNEFGPEEDRESRAIEFGPRLDQRPYRDDEDDLRRTARKEEDDKDDEDDLGYLTLTIEPGDMSLLERVFTAETETPDEDRERVSSLYQRLTMGATPS